MPLRPTPQQLIAELKTATGLKELQLARLIGVSQSTVNRWKRGLIADASYKYGLLEQAHRKYVARGEPTLVDEILDEVRARIETFDRDKLVDVRYKFRVFLSFYSGPDSPKT